MHHLINTSELVLRAGDVFTVSDAVACLVGSLAGRPEGKKRRKLCSPLTISISTSSVWIPSELNPLTFPLVPEHGPCPRAAVHPPGYTLTCELCLASEGPATDPAR